MRHNLDVLAAGLRTAGVLPPSRDEVRLGVRRNVPHRCCLWSITAMVDPAVTSVLLERLGIAVADHDSLASVGS
ncbi:hypothetical protein [Parafrankia sp. EUN1f]|uniref:hypothetical protein n=1 Tax=Parafrankia sp. EUN1f TaxID=102897 RepID=UPI0001C445E6|nr:hypothetical protein [Parafrankia sp. EUN1f]EFC86738.1 hypothetical protein FrEUN1fDRAFT_0220 [Parafrankia sp. EUN1f]